MSISEKVCYLKAGELFFIENGSLKPASLEEVTAPNIKMSLIIDDTYFFYVGMAQVSVTGKKLHSVAGNYLNIIFPGDMVKDFGVYQGGGFSLIFIISEELLSVIKEYPEIFQGAKKISTPFIELAARYEEFIFSDGMRKYKKNGGVVAAEGAVDDHVITANDLIAEIAIVKTSIQLPGVSKSKFAKTPYLIPATAIGVCYIIFLIGQIVSLSSISKVDKFYQDALNNIYKTAGVAESADPYGLLLYKSKQAGKSFDGKRVLTILSDLSTVIGSDGELNTISVRDKAVRIEGVTSDFAKVEQIEKNAEEKLMTEVSMDDTKKTEKGVSFVMRYEQ